MNTGLWSVIIIAAFYLVGIFLDDGKRLQLADYVLTGNGCGIIGSCYVITHGLVELL